jgi:hypothetical protein
MQFYYDFNKMMVTNPLEGITEFFVNPRMIDGFKQLRLDECCARDQVNLHEGLPIIILPLKELKLDNGIVQLDDDGKTGNIKAGGLTIYFKKVKLDNKPTLQINTVLGSRGSRYDSVTRVKFDETKSFDMFEALLKADIW